MDEAQKKEQGLERLSQALKAGDWLRMTDSARAKYLLDRRCSPEYADRITFYVMEYPSDSWQPLEDVADHFCGTGT